MPSRNHPGTIDRRGDTFRVRLLLGGKRYTFTLHTTDRHEAERFARTRYEELSRSQEVLHDRIRRGLPAVVTMSLLFDMFVVDALPGLAIGTQAAYRDSLKPLKTFFVETLGNPSLEAIDRGHINHFLTWRATHRLRGTTRLHGRTIAKDRAVLHRIFEYAMQSQLVSVNPVALTDTPSADSRNPVILSDDQYAKLLKACAERPMLELYVLVLGEAGLRCESEALWLRWDDVDLKEEFLHVVSGRDRHRTKSGRQRYVPMTSALIDAMRDHFARYRFAVYDGAQSPWIFHHAHNRRHARAGDRLRSLRAGFENAVRRAKIPAELNQHDLRHRRVTTWLADEKNPVHVKEAMGHADLATTMRYQHLAREHLRSLVQAPPRRERREGQS
jgi:site-specific recombinase XerD